jgi:hypothetical protein
VVADIAYQFRFAKSWNNGQSATVRRVEGVAGAVVRHARGFQATFDLPLTGPAGIECRTGGVNDDHQVVVTFPSPVTVAIVSVTTGSGSVSGFSVSGSQVTVSLTGVANAQIIVLTLFGVNNGTTTTNVSVPMGVPRG